MEDKGGCHAYLAFVLVVPSRQGVEAGFRVFRMPQAASAMSSRAEDEVSVDELWSDDFEVLHWVVERFEHNGHSIEVGEALRVFPEEQYDSVRASLSRLSTHTYLVAVNGGKHNRGNRHSAEPPGASAITERALGVAGGWSNKAEALADRILAVLAEGAVSETDPERRFKLKAGLKGVGGMTRDVLVGVVAAALARSDTTHWPPWPRARDTIAHDRA